MFDPIAYVLAKKKILMTQKKYDADLDNVIDLPSIPTIPRDKLGYPTVDVTFAYLSAINKTVMGSGGYNDEATIYTSDVFTDKAIKIGVCANVVQIAKLRWTGSPWIRGGDVYWVLQNTGKITSGHEVIKWVAGVATTLGSESVDLDMNIAYMYLCSISGSTINSYRDDFTTPKITVTDTDIASGRFGVATGQGDWEGKAEPLGAMLVSPASPLPSAKSIVEAEVIGSGKEEDPIRPNMKQELVEVANLTNVPEFLRREAKKYEILKNKGFTNEEIEALLDYIPQHQVDLASVTWGAFDYKQEHNTMLVTITGDNPYKEGAILKQVEHTKAKNLKVLKSPKDYREACEQYRQLRKDFTEWIAGKDNYAYQTLGHEVLEYFQVADTYYGNIVDGLKPKAYKNVPDWEMRKTINMWKQKLEKVNVLKEGAEKHLNKLKEVEKKGW